MLRCLIKWTAAIVCLFFLNLNFAIPLFGQLSDFQDVNFRKADSMAMLYQKYPLTKLPLLARNLTKPLPNDVEKFRAIYKWVFNNIDNDRALHARHKYQRERMKNRPHDFQQWNAKFSHKVFDRLRQEHKTICTGYAYLVKELSYHAGLKAEIVHGYGRTALSNVKGEGIPNHSWNAIYLNNKWYLCDPTWSSTVVPSQSGVSIKQYDDTYFLTEPGLFILDHYPLQAQWTLVDNPPTLTQFLNGPLVYKSALDHDILPNYPNSFGLEVKKGETVTFSVLSERDLSIHAFKLQVVKNGSENTNDLLFSNVKDDLYSLSQAFNRKGRYILHFLLDSDHLFSYELHVQ